MSGWLNAAYGRKANAVRVTAPEKVVTQPDLRRSNVVTQPKRDRAEYMRKYRAREKVCPHCGGKI
jgi:hypothetical protein